MDEERYGDGLNLTPILKHTHRSFKQFVPRTWKLVIGAYWEERRALCPKRVYGRNVVRAFVWNFIGISFLCFCLCDIRGHF